MSREELERLFDEKFSFICESMPIKSKDNKEFYELDDIKSFIFDTVIKEVLESALRDISEVDDEYLKWYDNCTIQIKQNIKELYWINL